MTTAFVFDKVNERYGIGIAAPAVKLHVVGDQRLSGYLGVGFSASAPVSTTAGHLTALRVFTTSLQYGAGIWTAVAFNASDFISDATAGASWTVGAGDVVTFRYMVIGNTVWVNVYLVTTTVGGAPTSLKIKIPGGFTALNSAIPNNCFISDNGVLSTGNVITVADTYIYINRYDNVPWTPGANTTALAFTVAIEYA